MAFKFMRMRGIMRGIKWPYPAPSPALKVSEEGANSASAGYAGYLSRVAGKKRSISVFHRGEGKHTPHPPHPPRFHNTAKAGSDGQPSGEGARSGALPNVESGRPTDRPAAPADRLAEPAAQLASPTDLRDAQLANAEEDRLDALEEAECAVENAGGWRIEANRLRAQVRDLESALRSERHEHAETREKLARVEATPTGTHDGELADIVSAVIAGARLVITPQPPQPPDATASADPRLARAAIVWTQYHALTTGDWHSDRAMALRRELDALLVTPDCTTPDCTTPAGTGRTTTPGHDADPRDLTHPTTRTTRGDR